MTKLRRLASCFTLISALSVAAFAGDMNTPPCSPGDMNTPPCTAAQPEINDPISAEEAEATEATMTAETSVISTITETAVRAFLSLL